MINRLFILLLFVAVSAAIGQNTLTIDDAVSLALKNNYDISIAHNNSEIARVNNTAGNAGMLPSINANVGDNIALNQTDQKTSETPQNSINGALNNVLSAGVYLSWTLFDGGKMFVTRNKLNEIEKLGEIQYHDKILSTIFSVIVAYYDIIRQKQQLSSIQNILAYNKERVTFFQTSFDAGLTPKTNLLQAKIDLNVNLESELRQKTVITSAKRLLNRLLCRMPDDSIDAKDSISTDFVLDKSGLMEKIVSSNTNILALQKQIEIAALSIKEMEKQRLPRISVTGGYGFSQTDNTLRSPTINRVFGPQAGVSVTVPLFEGGNISRQVETARLQSSTTKTTAEDAKLQLYAEVQNLFDDFENQKQFLEMENTNLLLSKENLDISLSRLKYGQSTSLEVKTAEQSYEAAVTRLINIKYDLKVTETRIKQLSATLK
jgi:outer membrane protein TolC